MPNCEQLLGEVEAEETVVYEHDSVRDDKITIAPIEPQLALCIMGKSIIFLANTGATACDVVVSSDGSSIATEPQHIQYISQSTITVECFNRHKLAFQ